VSQEERPIFWEAIVSVILSKNVYLNMISRLNPIRFLFIGFDEE